VNQGEVEDICLLGSSRSEKARAVDEASASPMLSLLAHYLRVRTDGLVDQLGALFVGDEAGDGYRIRVFVG